MLRDTRRAEVPAALHHGFLHLRRNFGAASARSEHLRWPGWARTEPLPRYDRRSGLDWRTASAARQHGSNVDLFGDAQRIFKFDTKISDSAVNLCVSEQQLNRPEISGFAVDFRRLGPAQRMGAVAAGF